MTSSGNGERRGGGGGAERNVALAGGCESPFLSGIRITGGELFGPFVVGPPGIARSPVCVIRCGNTPGGREPNAPFVSRSSSSGAGTGIATAALCSGTPRTPVFVASAALGWRGAAGGGASTGAGVLTSVSSATSVLIAASFGASSRMLRATIERLLHPTLVAIGQRDLAVVLDRIGACGRPRASMPATVTRSAQVFGLVLEPLLEILEVAPKRHDGRQRHLGFELHRGRVLRQRPTCSRPS